MHRKTSFHVIWLLLFVLGVGGCERRQHLVEQHFLEFGTLIGITMITEDLNRAQQLLDEIERRLRIQRSQWHAWEESDLARFNRLLHSGSRVEVPASLGQLLKLSHEYHEASNGLFNPALGKLIAAYGFQGSDADMTAVAEIIRDIPNMRHLEFDGRTAVSRNQHLQIDLGGIAKGYAVGLISEYLDSNQVENYIVNAGGDMVIAGNRFGRPWSIGIQNPFAPGVVASLQIEGKLSLFTSGNYERRYREGGTLTHHIIDPRNGKPSLGQSSATVLVGDPVRADVAATALMIDGFNTAPDLASSLQVNDFLLISDQREILVSRSLADKIQIRVPWPLKIVN